MLSDKLGLGKGLCGLQNWHRLIDMFIIVTCTETVMTIVCQLSWKIMSAWGSAKEKINSVQSLLLHLENVRFLLRKLTESKMFVVQFVQLSWFICSVRNMVTVFQFGYLHLEWKPLQTARPSVLTGAALYLKPLFHLLRPFLHTPTRQTLPEDCTCFQCSVYSCDTNQPITHSRSKTLHAMGLDCAKIQSSRRMCPLRPVDTLRTSPAGRCTRTHAHTHSSPPPPLPFTLIHNVMLFLAT